MGLMYLARAAVFVLACICGVILIGIGANLNTYIWLISKPAFINLAIAAGGLALLTLPAMLAIDFFTSTSTILFTSWIVVEIVVTTLIWILFVSAAAAGSKIDFCLGTADACTKAHVVAAFGYFAFFILFVYSLVLLARAFLASRKRSSVWTTSVKEADL